MLILRTLATGPRHGLGIARRIEQVTRGTFSVTPGSLFPALHRLEQEGLIEGEWGESESRRRARYYRVTSEGRRRLGDETRDWQRVVAAVGRVLESD